MENLELFPERHIYRVCDLVEQLRGLVEHGFSNIWVQGEVSNFSRHSSGHMYFSLKDSQAQLHCAYFRMQNRYLRFTPRNGLEVLVRGRASVYGQKGELQLIVEFMEPRGLGSLQFAFEQLKVKLQAQGLFDSAHKRPLPLLPRKIGVVTSATGAAIQDILRVLGRRNQRVQVLIYNARVQGDGAAGEIVRGLRYLNRRSDLDVLILARGGGSLEDFLPFNDEGVARAIYESRLPVISAVGHEVDFTIADFVADVRAATPSQAAELVAAASAELCEKIEALARRAEHNLRRLLERKRLALGRLSDNRAFADAENKFRQLLQRLDDLDQRLAGAARHYMERRRHSLQRFDARLRSVDFRRWVQLQHNRLETLTARGRHAAAQLLQTRQQSLGVLGTALDAISPLRVLDRGYAIVLDASDRVIKSSSQVESGEHVRVRLAEGGLDCEVRDKY